MGLKQTGTHHQTTSFNNYGKSSAVGKWQHVLLLVSNNCPVLQKGHTLILSHYLVMCGSNNEGHCDELSCVLWKMYGKKYIYFVPICHIVAYILTRLNFDQISLLVIKWSHIPTDQLYLPQINCSKHWSAVANNGKLCLALISNPLQWSTVLITDQQSLTWISCPWHWSAVPNYGLANHC